MSEQFEKVGNLMVKNSLQGFDAEEIYIHPRNRSVSFQKRCKCFVFIIFEYSHDAVSKMWWLEFHFQNLPFLKSTRKECAVFV